MRMLKILFIVITIGFCHNLSATIFHDAGDRFNVDPKLLYSISQIESNSHPWTLNINGVPVFLSTKEDAVRTFYIARENPFLVLINGKIPKNGYVSNYFFSSYASAEVFINENSYLRKAKVKKININNIDIGLM